MGARAGLGNRAGGPGLRPLWPCRVRPGLRGGTGRRGHRRVTGVSPGCHRACCVQASPFHSAGDVSATSRGMWRVGPSPRDGLSQGH